MKKYFKIIIGGTILLSLIGCGDKSKNTMVIEPKVDVKQKETLTYVNFRDIRDLNPHLYAGEMYAQEMLFETLINIGKNGYEPALAESWNISSDGRIYTFNIRKGVKFSDGTICDAKAIKQNFDAILDNKSRHTWLEMMKLLDSIEVLDDYVLQIKLKEAYYPMLTELAVTRPFAMISPKVMKDETTKNGVLAYIGTGPYILKELITDEVAIFEANENYWGDIPKIKKVIVKVIPDNQTRILALEKGEIDLIFGKNMLDADAINKYKNNEKFKVLLSEPTSTRQIVINTNNETLKDINVRYALQHATNRETISKGIFYGLEAPAETLYAKTVPYANIDLKPFEFNIEKSEVLLDKAGWLKTNSGIREKNGKKLELELLYNSDSVTEKVIAEYLQSEYKKIGVIININGEEEQSYRDKMKSGNFDMVFNISWGLPYDPQSSLSAMRQPVYGDYVAQLGLHNKKEIDEAIDKILVSTDEIERQNLYKFVLESLHDDAVYIPITYECNKALFINNLKNVDFTQTQYEVPFQQMYFE